MTWKQTAPSKLDDGWAMPASDILWTDGTNFVRTRVAFDATASGFGSLIFRVSGAWANEDGSVRQVRGHNAIEPAPLCLTVQSDAPEDIAALKLQAAQDTAERVARMIAVEQQAEAL